MATHPLHEKAKILVKDFLTLEVQLIKLLQEIEQGKVHFFLPGLEQSTGASKSGLLPKKNRHDRVPPKTGGMACESRPHSRPTSEQVCSGDARALKKWVTPGNLDDL